MKLAPATCAGVLLLSVACGVRPRLPVAGATSTREGVSSVRVLEDDAKKQPPADAVVETITPAFASDDNRLPEYPGYALKAGCKRGVVPIRLYVNVDGNVARIDPVPNRPVAEDQCHSAFWASTCAAVQAWRFSPAFRQTPGSGPDIDGDGYPDFTRWEQAPIMIYLDFEFTFRVVEGKGQVLSR
jgi:hypothetical protein